MSNVSAELENLARYRKLIREPPNATEIDAYLNKGTDRLKDARMPALSLSSRFGLIYSAAHAFARAALRLAGYRTDSRALTFLCLEHTLGISAQDCRLFSTANDIRNAITYGGDPDPHEGFLDNLLQASLDLEKHTLAQHAKWVAENKPHLPEP